MDHSDKFSSWLSMYGVGEEDELNTSETQGTFLYRNEKRLTTAITATHILGYLRGESIKSYKEFLDTTLSMTHWSWINVGTIKSCCKRN